MSEYLELNVILDKEVIEQVLDTGGLHIVRGAGDVKFVGDLDVFTEDTLNDPNQIAHYVCSIDDFASTGKYRGVKVIWASGKKWSRRVIKLTKQEAEALVDDDNQTVTDTLVIAGE